MKRILITLTTIILSAMTLFAQGRVNFNNFSAGLQPVTIVSFLFEPGVFAGANYSIQLLWSPGTYANYSAFLAANPSSSPVFAFFGTTGTLPAHGPLVDGTGLFDGGTVQMGGPAGTYTMLARGWYNNGVYATYNAAQAAGVNVGISSLIQVAVTESPTPAPDTRFPAFSIGVIPEPSAFALGALGAACLVLFHRKNRR